jgi:hypothetical protein
MRWDEDRKTAVPASKAERDAARSAQQHPTGAAAQYEHYHDEESLQTFVRREVAPPVRTLLTRQNASWDSLHILLAKYHLRIEKGEAGGYTLLAIDHTIRVKTSDVFRHNFAGKENRKATEQILGLWKEPATTLQLPPADTGRTAVRNQTLRAERREQRLQGRKALLFEYNQYRNQQRAFCKGITAKGREDRQQSLTRLKQRKKEIRASAQPWPTKKIFLSEAVAASVIELRTLKLSTQRTRQAQFPKSLRTWVHVVHNTWHQTDQPVRMLGNLDRAPQLIYNRPCTAWVKCNAEYQPCAKPLHTCTSSARARSAAVISDVASMGFPRK